MYLILKPESSKYFYFDFKNRELFPKADFILKMTIIYLICTKDQSTRWLKCHLLSMPTGQTHTEG